MNPDRWWAFALCIVALAPYALFVAFYALRSPWWSSPVGRSLMLSKFVIVLLLSHVLVVLAAGDYTYRIAVWAVLFVMVAIAGATQFVLLLRLQRRISNGDNPRRRASDQKEILR